MAGDYRLEPTLATRIAAGTTAGTNLTGGDPIVPYLARAENPLRERSRGS